jgi:hypothetical protein
MVIREASRADRAEEPAPLDLAVHRRILAFLNDAIQPQDLVYQKPPPPNPEMHHDGDASPADRLRDRLVILDPDIAQEIIDFRDREFPLGFRNLKELDALEVFGRDHVDILRHVFSNVFYGSWSVFPQNIPRRGRAATTAWCTRPWCTPARCCSSPRTRPPCCGTPTTRPRRRSRTRSTNRT